jgi:hypothetical protein
MADEELVGKCLNTGLRKCSANGGAGGQVFTAIDACGLRLAIERRLHLWVTLAYATCSRPCSPRVLVRSESGTGVSPVRGCTGGTPVPPDFRFYQYLPECPPESPTILREGPYRFYFYSHEPNEPPHVHVDRDDLSCKFWLTPVSPAYNLGFNSRELRQIESIVIKRREQFVRDWNDYFSA